MNIVTEIAAYSLLHALQTAADPALNELAANATLRAAARRVELTAPRLPSWAPPETAEETLTRAIRYTLLRALTLAAAPAIIELSRAVEGGKLTVPAACRRLQAALPDFSTLAADVLARLTSDPVTAAAKRCRSKNPAHCRVHGVPLKKNQPRYLGGIDPRHAREHKTRSRKQKQYGYTAGGEHSTPAAEREELTVRSHVTSYKDVRRALAPASKLYGKTGRGSVAPGMKEEFFISKNCIDELTSGKHVKLSADRHSHFTAAANIQMLWEKSRPLSRKRDLYHPYEKSDIEWVHKRVADLNIAGEKYEVTITAKEFKPRTKAPNILYQVRTKAKKKRGAF